MCILAITISKYISKRNCTCQLKKLILYTKLIYNIYYDFNLLWKFCAQHSPYQSLGQGKFKDLKQSLFYIAFKDTMKSVSFQRHCITFKLYKASFPVCYDKKKFNFNYNFFPNSKHSCSKNLHYRTFPEPRAMCWIRGITSCIILVGQ